MKAMKPKMKPKTKTKQIVVRFDGHSYDIISTYAEKEHRGLGEFVRHTALYYIEHFDKGKEPLSETEGKQKTTDS